MMSKDEEKEKLDLPKEIYEELEKISKMEKTLDNFSESVKKTQSLSEDKKDENVIKKDAVSVILSAKEKRRYENLGKAFMDGANSIINEIQDSIEKKERNSLEKNQEIEDKIKEAEEQKEETKKKKTSVVSKILIATAAIGALYLIFHESINTGIMNMYNIVKNGMMGFGDFIKKSASAIFSFFGNMFIKASEALNGGGVMTIILTSIIKEFFGNTLPKLVIHITQDFMRIINKDFTATEWKPDSGINETVEKIDKKTKTKTDTLLDELSKVKLNFEKDILKDGSMSIEEQEKYADKTIDSFGDRISELISNLKEENTNNIKLWLNGIYEHLASNQISSTAFYHNAQKVIEGFENLKIGDNFDALKEHEKLFIQKFAENHGALLSMTQDAITEYGQMTGDEQIKFVKNLISTLKNHNENVLNTIKNSNPEAVAAKKEEDSVVKILQDIRNEVEKKGDTATIIQFQETTQLGELQKTIKDFINDTGFVDVMTKFASATQDKFSIILDASNKALARLSKDIASEFVLETVNEVNGNETSNAVSSSEEENKSLLVPNADDYKIMYIFNNTASTNDAAVLNKMEQFFNSAGDYLNVISEEVESVTRLEALTQFLYSIITTYTRQVIKHAYNTERRYQTTVTLLDSHAKKEVKEGNDSAHPLIINRDNAMALTPMISNFELLS